MWGRESPSASRAETRFASRPESHQRASRWRDWSRQQAVARQPAIDTGCTRATLGDCPHDQALAASHVAARENPWLAGHKNGVARHVATRIQLHAERFQHGAAFGTNKAHGQQHQLALHLKIRAVDLQELAVDEFHFVRTQTCQIAKLVADETFSVHAVDALATFFVSRRNSKHV